MRFRQPTAELVIPDSTPLPEALRRTTHLGVAAHPDDLEIMAIDGILQCFGSSDRWFCGVEVTDGGGSPQDDRHPSATADEMRQIRRKEQVKAAGIGEYGALIMLDYPSATVKNGPDRSLRDDLIEILSETRPEMVYTHNLADKHDTHVAVALHLIEAVRSLDPGLRPRRIYGCEVWRDLDWLVDADKTVFDVGRRKNLQAALLGVFDSQISRGKRYDLAVMGRRRAQATFLDSHAVDRSDAALFAMDLTPLAERDDLDIGVFVKAFLERFHRDVLDRIHLLSGN